MNTFISFLSLAIVISFTSCEDPDPLADCKADPNCEYFECLVDGERWTPSCTPDPLFGCDPFDVQYYKENGTIEAIIQATEIGNTIKLNLFGIKLKINEIYNFYSGPSIKTGIAISNSNIDCIFHELIASKENKISFTKIDTLNFILEGSFNFQAINKCNSTKNLENGKFRLKYRF